MTLSGYSGFEPYTVDDEEHAWEIRKNRGMNVFGEPTIYRYSPTSTQSLEYQQDIIDAQTRAGIAAAQATTAARAGYEVVPTSSTTTSRTEYTGKAPKYESPEWDEKKIRSLSRKISGAGIRQLRQQVQQQTAKYYENPNVRAIMLRNALQGYGIGLEKVISGAEAQARGEYAQKYSFDVQEAMNKFQAAWNEYMSTGKKVQETATQYTTAGKIAGDIGTEAPETQYTEGSYLDPRNTSVIAQIRRQYATGESPWIGPGKRRSNIGMRVW